MTESIELNNFQVVATVLYKNEGLCIETTKTFAVIERFGIYYINFGPASLELEVDEPFRSGFALRLKTKKSLKAVTILSALKFIRVSYSLDRRREVIKFYLEYSKESAEPWHLKSEIIEMGLGLRR